MAWRVELAVNLHAEVLGSSDQEPDFEMRELDGIPAASAEDPRACHIVTFLSLAFLNC